MSLVMVNDTVRPLCFLVFALLLAMAYVKWKTWKYRRAKHGTNRLEVLLREEVGRVTREEFERELLGAQLYAMQCASNPDRPMTLGFRVASELRPSNEVSNAGPDGLVEYSPQLLCWSSRFAVKGARRSFPYLKPVLFNRFRIVAFPARTLIRYAIDEGVDLVLNPFFGVGMTIDQASLRAMLDKVDCPAIVGEKHTN